MKFFILISSLILSLQSTLFSSTTSIPIAMALNKKVIDPKLTITYPRDRQQVDGTSKIRGKAMPGATVTLEITSSYYKIYRYKSRISKGAGPLKRLKNTYHLTANLGGFWEIENIDLTNAGWEETFKIKATSNQKTAITTVRGKGHSFPID